MMSSEASLADEIHPDDSGRLQNHRSGHEPAADRRCHKLFHLIAPVVPDDDGDKIC